jgi:WD40 repeat protein
MIVLEGRKQDVDALVFSPDGLELAVGGTGSHVQLWDLAQGKAKPVLGPQGPHRGVGFLADDLLFTVTGGRAVRVTSRRTPEPPVEVQTDANYIHAAATADGKALVLVGQLNYGPYLECRELPDLRLRWARRGEGRFIPFRICSCPDGQMVYATDIAAHLLDPQTGQTLRHILSHSNAVPAVAVSADGTLLAVAAGMQLEVCELASGQKRGSARSSGRRHFTDVAFHPSGRVLAASSNNETVRMFDTSSLAEVAAFNWEIGPVRRLAFAPDGLRAAAAGKTGRIVVWDVDW